MILQATLLTCLALLIIVNNEASAAIITRKGVFDAQGNYVAYPIKQSSDTDCCLIPTCNRYGECYDAVNCGYSCTQGSYKPISYGSTPGFHLKRHHEKEDCHFGVCQVYDFLCNHCPDPREDGFNIYTVRRDCRDCYYKNN